MQDRRFKQLINFLKKKKVNVLIQKNFFCQDGSPDATVSLGERKIFLYLPEKTKLKQKRFVERCIHLLIHEFGHLLLYKKDYFHTEYDAWYVPTKHEIFKYANPRTYYKDRDFYLSFYGEEAFEPSFPEVEYKLTKTKKQKPIQNQRVRNIKKL